MPTFVARSQPDRNRDAVLKHPKGVAIVARFSEPKALTERARGALSASLSAFIGPVPKLLASFGTLKNKAAQTTSTANFSFL